MSDPIGQLRDLIAASNCENSSVGSRAYRQLVAVLTSTPVAEAMVGMRDALVAASTQLHPVMATHSEPDPHEPGRTIHAEDGWVCDCGNFLGTEDDPDDISLGHADGCSWVAAGSALSAFDTALAEALRRIDHAS